MRDVPIVREPGLHVSPVTTLSIYMIQNRIQTTFPKKFGMHTNKIRKTFKWLFSMK